MEVITLISYKTYSNHLQYLIGRKGTIIVALSNDEVTVTLSPAFMTFIIKGYIS